MATIVSVSGSSFAVPVEGDDGWADNVSGLLIQLANSTKVLQLESSTFSLTQELSFGISFGLKAQYIKSQSAQPAGSGIFRLGNTESIKWRNFLNTLDLDLTVNTANILTYNGSPVLTGGLGGIVNADISASAAIAYTKLNLGLSIVNADIAIAAGIAYSKLALSNSILNADINASAAIAYSKLALSNTIANTDINASAAIAYSKLAALTTSRALQSNASTGVVEVSAVTNTELGFVSGVTSAIQTQVNTKITNPLTTDGDILARLAGVPARLALGSSGQVLKSVGGLPTWATFSGGINYVSSNPDAESDTSGWVTYLDAAGVAPVDGTGGTAVSTFTRSTVTPLRGTASFLWTKTAVNRQGEGFSYNFTIDSTDKAKVIQVEFDYIIQSGTFVAGTTIPLADSDVTVWIYDVTNAIMIPLSSRSLLSNSLTTSDKFTSSFQSAANSVSYRLVFHVGTTSALAYSLGFDNFKVGPSVYIFGSPVTDWVSYNPTWNSSGTQPVIGNGTIVGRYRFVGDSAEVFAAVYSGTTTTFGTGNYTFGMPTIFNIDGTKINTDGDRTTIGVGTAFGSAARSASVTLASGTAGANKATLIAGTSIVSNTAPEVWAGSNMSFEMQLSYPVVGRSSSIQASDGFDSRAILLRAGTTTAATNIATTTTILGFDTAVVDTVSGYNSTTFRYVVQSSGYYEIDLRLSVNVTVFSALTPVNAYITINGASAGFTKTFAQTTGFMTVSPVKWIGYLKAGDYVEPVAVKDTASITVNLHNDINFSGLFIQKIQAPTTLSATELVACRYTNSAGTAFPLSSTTMVFPNKVYDSHSAFNAATGTFTCPYPAKYQVTVKMTTTVATFSTTQAGRALLFKTGASQSEVAAIGGTGGNTNYRMNGSDTIDCLAGDTLQIRTDSQVATNLLTDAAFNYITIEMIK